MYSLRVDGSSAAALPVVGRTKARPEQTWASLLRLQSRGCRCLNQLPERLLQELFPTVFEVAPLARTPPPVEVPLLARFPVEILLHIVSFLPPESAVSLSLASRHYHTLLSRDIDLTLKQDQPAKKRLLRLLEVDWPHLMACHACNILFAWKRKPHRAARSIYTCPSSGRQSSSHFSGISLCCGYLHPDMSFSIVEAYIRGYELGPAYGPPLSELTHSCRGRLQSDDRREARLTVRARVVQGKFLLHHTMRANICLVSSLVLEVHRFRHFGCQHTSWHLPAVIMDAVEHHDADRSSSGSSSKGQPATKTRSLDFINCAMCATDFRIKITSQTPRNLSLVVEAWQCFGGRDSDQRDPMEQATLQLVTPRADLSKPLTRRLECLYNRGQELHGSSRRTWLQLWQWRLFHSGALEYKVANAEGNKMVDGERRTNLLMTNQ